jgi:hypothetical protein
MTSRSILVDRYKGKKVWMKNGIYKREIASTGEEGDLGLVSVSAKFEVKSGKPILDKYVGIQKQW